MQNKEVKAELKVSRKRSGLTNGDLATLLNIDPARVSRLERERLQPNVQELIALCLIYDRDIVRLYPRSSAAVHTSLRQRIDKIDPKPKSTHQRYEARQRHLSELYQRLEGIASA